jgi:HEPN domain-containing protein
MDNNNKQEWLKRAKSNLEWVKKTDKNDLVINGGYIFFEELCFGLQQCTEKSIKALLLHHNIDFPKTHSISKLIDILKENNKKFPDSLLPAIDLTLYAVETRYPSINNHVSEQDFQQALEIAQNVYDWVEKICS